MHRNGRVSSLFSIERRFPKLDVAGSIPVSRSMKSIIYSDSESLWPVQNGVKRSNHILNHSNDEDERQLNTLTVHVFEILFRSVTTCAAEHTVSAGL
jgi:hypothetical protein